MKKKFHPTRVKLFPIINNFKNLLISNLELWYNFFNIYNTISKFFLKLFINIKYSLNFWIQHLTDFDLDIVQILHEATIDGQK